MNVDWSVESIDGTALVTVELHNPMPVDRRVRVENRLAGEVLPPRRQGVPERGWDEDGYAGVVAAGEQLSLGYACPASVERPPVTVFDEGRVDDAPDEPTVETAIRELGDPSPPADAVPLPTVEGRENLAIVADGDSAGDVESTGEGDSTVERDDCTDGAEEDALASPSEEGPTPDASRSSTDSTDYIPSETAEDLPPAVATWLDSVERRVEHGEGLTDASVVEAADVLESAGGVDAVASLPETLTADADALRAVASTAERLAARAEETDVPVDALRRLA